MNIEKLNPIEKEELGCWLATHVTGWKTDDREEDSYSIDEPAVTLKLLEACGRKCTIMLSAMGSGRSEPNWFACGTNMNGDTRYSGTLGSTLQETIALFVKKLYRPKEAETSTICKT